MSTAKKQPKAQEDLQTILQRLIAQGQKEGMIRASELSTHLDKLNLPSEKLEEIYDQLEAMNIQIISADLDLDLDFVYQEELVFHLYLIYQDMKLRLIQHQFHRLPNQRLIEVIQNLKQIFQDFLLLL